MTMTSEEFVKSFHSLNGITIGEKRKNLFFLLKRTQETLRSGSGDIEFASIQPKTALEESFLVEAYIYFKRVPDLINTLKSENPVLIEKVLKISSWFLEELLSSIGEKQLIEQLFPYLSFNAKVKLINKLTAYLNNSQQADAIFTAIYDRYGMYLASKLLPCCSGDLIMKHVKSVRIEFTSRQLLMIIKRNPQITEDILEALAQLDSKNHVSCKYRKIFIYLMNNDTELFLKLHKDYKPLFHIGWRATDRLISANKQRVIKNAQQLQQFLHNKQIVKSTGQDFSEFYLNMFPTSESKFGRNLNLYLNLMNALPSNASKLDLILKTFKKSYGSELWNNSSYIAPDILELMTPDERELWMQKNAKPAGMLEDVWTCLMKTEVSIPALKKKIALTSNAKEQAELVGCLVETCRINGDRTVLTDVCKYIVTQHRNSNPSVLHSFLKSLRKCFSFDTLSEEEWKCVTDIAHVFINKKLSPYYYHEYFYDYMHYRLVKNLSIKQQLLDFSKKAHLGGDGGSSYMKEPKYQKQMILEFFSVLPEIYKEDELNNVYIQFLYSVMNFNRKNLKHAIPIFSFVDAINVLEKELANPNYNYMVETILKYFISISQSKTELTKWLELLCNRKTMCCDMMTVEWLIKQEPDLFLKYADRLVDLILNMWYTQIYPFFWKLCRNYTHLEIPQKIIAFCVKIVKSQNENDSRKHNAITALSYLMNPTEFLKFIEPYYPTDLKMDVANEENDELYKKQQAITASLKNVIPPSVTLESVLNFSKGDYLKFIQRSLHSVFLNVAENKLSPLFMGLSTGAVSVRKHVIYHSFKVLDKNEVSRMLNKWMETEKNSSIRKFLFKAILHFFARNPEDHVWSLVKENAKAIDVNDSEGLEMLMQAKKIPLQYLSQYVIFTWNILETFPNNPDLEVCKGQLFDTVNSDAMSALPEDFCMTIIKEYMFCSSTFLQLKSFEFACKFILYGAAEEQENRLGSVFALVEDYFRLSSSSLEKKNLWCNFAIRFVNTFCSFYLEKISSDRNIFTKFIELWNNLFEPHESIENYLHLQFTLIYLDFVTYNLTLVQVGNNIAKLCDSLLNIYGPAATTIFGNSLNLCMTYFLQEIDESRDAAELMLIENVIKAANSSHCLLMAILLLPQTVPSVPQSVFVIYNRIIDILEQSVDPVVQLFLSRYLHTTCEFRNDIIMRDRPTTKVSNKNQLCFGYIEEYQNKYRSSLVCV